MTKIYDEISDYFMFTKKSEIALVITMFLAVLCLTGYAIYEEYSNKRNIEIVISDSFFGEVTDKKIRARPSIMGYLDSYNIYFMNIVGEYLSNDGDVINFDRMIRVDKDMYENYEIGDFLPQ